ncbi:uncharacterized protein EAF01_011086 [Botrytis porri]|uniref:Heterokaryon incompatibility domain-containing protein n=1 Tax=Botrytis porri TaxID=87229 RepID=A0A4Z1KMU6_9HELO|nr:uncharacterized protein EAF01_011086 [Botrytis porri]KAF7887932.1 hypothetical protein EAF01_011086 [Botrytis porri]TGO85652.1 hypothetical protein BPOR_0375g00010 [Botrytis porri]
MGEPEPYEALSYCWGDAICKVPITVNGKRFDVITNLFAAMQKLKETDNDNDEKKSKEMLVMRDVYKKTERCLFWLGEFEDTKPVATIFDLIRKGKELQCASDINNLPPKDKYRFWESLGLLGIDISAWGIVDNIMAAPWWKRVWVIQKITFLKEVVAICRSEK